MSSPSSASVVFVIANLHGGGGERFVLTMARAFARLGYQSHIITFKPLADYSTDQQVHYHCLHNPLDKFLPKGTLRYSWAARVLDNYIRHHIGTPVLIVSNLYTADRILHYSKLPNIVHVLHNTLSIEYNLTADASGKQTAFLKQLYGNRPLAAVSRGVMEDYLHHINPEARVKAILNPIDRDHIVAQAQTEKSPYMGGYLINVSRLHAQKDHATLIRAYVASAQTLPLVLVGKGEEEDNCRRLVQELGIADQVIFTGFQANPYPLIAHATGFVLSSRYEGMPMVILEALTLGTPFISTDCPSGPNELLPLHCLVPVGDIAALSEKMNELMQEPERFKIPFNEDLLPGKVALRYLEWVRQCEVT
ncbi:glycosyltransferase [Stenoxybacter acetivorans]|uniref:glycosyltransferase n=1 Tax=Stenoxybacter acetivorans TaxID=422441 RepID=UPI000568F0A9|nr:glycosyltransferase [Stenoxybacter acetivorans]